MAGGKFDPSVGKIRPGTYTNVVSTAEQSMPTGTRGVVTIPLIGHDYGPAKQFIHISAMSPDAHKAQLGYSVFDATSKSALMIREALKNAAEVLAYIPATGTKATVATTGYSITAKYGGKRGNDLCVVIAANPEGGFDVKVYLGTNRVEEFVGVKTVGDVIAAGSEWVVFAAVGDPGAETDLVANAGLQLEGGANAEVATADITAYLDALDGEQWNVLAFPLAPTGESGDTNRALCEAVKSKIAALRDGSGKYRHAVVCKFAADYEGITNVTNGVVLNDGTEITADIATAWVAGVYAASDIAVSNTYHTYPNAVKVFGAKTDEEAETAIKAGEFFFTVGDAGDVCVEYDINSLTTFDKPKHESFRKNRVMRAIDGICTELKLRIPPNRYDNNETGWSQIAGVAKALLMEYQNAGAIQNVDTDSDIVIDKAKSVGDSTYISVAIKPVDSAEKIYLTVAVGQ